MRPVLHALLSVALLTATPPSAGALDGGDCTPPGGDPPPNVLLIIADDFGAQSLAMYGGECAPSTPNLEEIRQAGVQFSTVWSAPRCTPTRAAILTGKYGFRTGVGNPYDHDAAHPGSGAAYTEHPLGADEVVLPRILRDAWCYRSKLFGKWHLGHPDNGGLDSVTQYPNPVAWFDEFAGTMLNPTGPLGYWNYDWATGTCTSPTVENPKTNYLPQRTVNRVISYIENDPGTDPWFAVLSFNLPHAPPHDPPGAFPLPPCTTHPKYRKMMEEMDRQIGRVLDTLEAEELVDETVVFFVGDNGTDGNALPAPASTKAKGTLYEGGIHVPLLVRGPVVAAANEGTVCDELVHVTDLFATIADIAGIDLEAEYPQETFDGYSFLPKLMGTSWRGRPFLFTEDFFPNGTALESLVAGLPEVWDEESVLYSASNEVSSGYTDVRLQVMGPSSPGFPESFTFGNELDLVLTSQVGAPATPLEVVIFAGPAHAFPAEPCGSKLTWPCYTSVAAEPMTDETLTVHLSRDESVSIFDHAGWASCADPAMDEVMDVLSSQVEGFYVQIGLHDGSGNWCYTNAVELNFHWLGAAAVRDEQYKLIRYGRGGKELYFDLLDDPDEENDLLEGLAPTDPRPTDYEKLLAYMSDVFQS